MASDNVWLPSNEKLKAMGFEFRDNNSTMMYTLDYLREAGFIGK